MKLAATKKQEISIPASNMLAITMDGCRNTRKVRVRVINTNLNRGVGHHPINGKFSPEVIQSLIRDIEGSKRVFIYTRGIVNGWLTASGTPLYTNNMETVVRIYLDGRIIYDVYNEQGV